MERKTVNFSSPPVWLRRYATPGTPEHRAMLRVVSEAEGVISSESAVLLALVEHAHAEVEQEKLRMLYDEAYSAAGPDTDAADAMTTLESDYAAYIEGEA
jgi:hypothetical protein